MLAVITERPGVQGWVLKVPGTRHLMVNHFVIFFEPLRCITQSLSIKQSTGQDVPTSSGESSDSSGA